MIHAMTMEWAAGDDDGDGGPMEEMRRHHDEGRSACGSSSSARLITANLSFANKGKGQESFQHNHHKRAMYGRRGRESNIWT